MVWVDYDQDNLIDIVESDSGWFKQKNLQYGIQIGDSAHWAANKSYYKDVKFLDSANTIPVCYTHKPENSGNTIRIIRFSKYTGPSGGEWIKGDWGVDEEKMDGKDNDCDGVIDEDTRIVQDTLDDDGDWIDTNKNGKKRHYAMERCKP